MSTIIFSQLTKHKQDYTTDQVSALPSRIRLLGEACKPEGRQLLPGSVTWEDRRGYLGVTWSCYMECYLGIIWVVILGKFFCDPKMPAFLKLGLLKKHYFYL